MKRKLLSLLKVRDIGYVSNVKLINGQPLPPIFKLFNCIYEIDSFENVEINKYEFTKGELVEFDIATYHFSNPSIHIYQFFSIEKIDEMIPKLFDINDELDNNLLALNLIPIAISSSNQLLMLGMGVNNMDKIFYETKWNNNRLELIADNIFDFFRGIELEPQTNKWLPNLNQLYRNWGEDFWRVREE